MPRLLPVLILCAFAAPVAFARTNVLLIAFDDLNDWVRPLGGHPLAHTPNFDRLAARGTTFVNAHAQAVLCNPSRASFLLSRRPSSTGLYALDGWIRDVPALRGQRTLFQHFAAHGYRTLTTGKVFHDAYPPPAARTNGTEVEVWGPHGGFQPRPPRKFVATPDPNPLVDWGAFPARDEDCFDWGLTSWAVERLREPAADGRPFLLAVGLRHPHVPLYAPPRWFELFPLDDPRLLPAARADERAGVPAFAWFLHWRLPEPRLAWLQAAGQWEAKVRAYLASVSYADAMLGRLLDALDAGPHARDTVVVLFSDHGYHLGEKGITGKNSLWERATRVPLLFAGPGVRAGQVCRRPAELLDVYPTLAELCGLPAPAGVEGRSLRPQLRNPRARRDAPALTTHGPHNHAVRTGRWRYIRYADGSEELYDHARDPREWDNLASSPAHARVKARLAEHLPAVNAPPLPGTRVRLVERRDGEVFWEGQVIPPGSPVPE
jgi:arylsulfatase A-like enzyme